MSGRTQARGAALVFAVLLSMALLGLAHGALVSSRFALTAARAGARHLGLQAVADGAVRGAVRDSQAGDLDGLPVGGVHLSSDSAGAIRWELAWLRLTRELWLVEAVASGATAGRARSGAVVHRPDPVALLARLPGVVSVPPEASSSPLGVIEGSSLGDAASGCPPWSDALGAASLDGAVDAVGVLSAPDAARVDSLLERAAHVTPLPSSGTPAPSAWAGECATDDGWNWGDPDDPAAACGAFRPLRRGGDSLRVEGGRGQLLLVVDGDLLVRAGSRLQGFFVVTGRVTVEGASRLDGFVVAGGGFTVEEGSAIVGDACRAVVAVAAHRELLGGPTSAHPARRLGPR